jgi:hypothetical protein
MAPMAQVVGWPAWLSLGLVALSLALAIAHAVRPTRTTLVWSVVALAVSLLGGILGTVLGLMGSFGGIAPVDPSMKATVLAEGISAAMNSTAFALVGSVLWGIPFVVGEVRRRRASPGRPGGGAR